MDVLVKQEPRVEGEELMENEYHAKLDPLVLRTETDLWCDCPPVGKLSWGNVASSMGVIKANLSL